MNEVLGDGPAPHLRGEAFEWRKALLCQVRQSHPTGTGCVAASCAVGAHVSGVHRNIRAFKGPMKKPQCVSIEALLMNEVLGDGPAPHPRGGSFEFHSLVVLDRRAALAKTGSLR